MSAEGSLTDELASLLDASGGSLKGGAAGLVKSHILASFMGPRRSTVSNLICLGGRSDKDWTAEYRLYSKERADAGPLFATALGEALGPSPGDAPLVVGIDDTLVRKTGRNITGVAWRRDPLGPPFQTNLVRGQRFLMFSAARDLGGGEAQMLPIRFEHAPTAARPPAKASEKELEEWRGEKKRTSLGARTVKGLEELAASHPGRKIIAVGDGGYTIGSVIKKKPATVSYIGRMRKDAKLHHKPDARPAESGRPRSYGERAPTPDELLRDDKAPWREVVATASGRRHTFRVKEMGGLLWRPAGSDTQVRVIVIAPTGYHLRKGSKLLYRQPAFLLCTDPDLTIGEILQYYIWRWGVEVNFRDVKELVGVGEAMVRTEPSNRTLPAVLVAGYSLLWAAALRMLRAGVNPVAGLEAPKWRAGIEAGRKRPSTGQLLRQVRAECWGEAIESRAFDGFVNGQEADAKPEKFRIKVRDAIRTA